MERISYRNPGHVEEYEHSFSRPGNGLKTANYYYTGVKILKNFIYFF